MNQQRLGDYELLERIGAGGMGLVYRARDASGREVALKVGPVPTSANDPHLERFRREGWITADLRHPHIVPIHDAGVVEGRPYLAFALVDQARTLQDALPGWSLRQRVAALRDVALGLAHAHRAGIVHRDVKPSNVLVCQDDRVLLADFGVASVQGLDGLTQSAAVLGTPLYMAPESIREGASRAGPQADVFALGVMLYEALTNEHPYAERGLPALWLGEQRRLPSPAEGHPDVPEALSRTCARAMHMDPARRQPGAAVLAEELQAWLDGRAPPTRRRRVAAATVGLLALAAGVLTTRTLWPDSGAPATPAVDPQASSPTPLPARPDPRADLLAQGAAQLAAGEPPSSLWPLLETLAELPPAGPDAPRDVLGDRLAATLPDVFQRDLGEGFRLLQAMARGGLRLSDRRGGDTLVDAIHSAHLLNSISGADYWRGLAAAACLDAPVRSMHCSPRSGLRQSERPASTGPLRTWLDYVELLRLAAQGRLRQVAPELRALLDSSDPFVRLGPHGKAMVAVILLSRDDPEAESLLGLARAYAPDDPLVWRAAGYVAGNLEQYPRALRATQRALQLFEQQRFASLFSLAPERAHMLRQLLKIQLLLEDSTSALATYRELVRTNVDVAEEAVAEDPGVAELVEEAGSPRDD